MLLIIFCVWYKTLHLQQNGQYKIPFTYINGRVGDALRNIFYWKKILRQEINFNFLQIFCVNPFIYATEFWMHHRMWNNACRIRIPVELQYCEWQKRLSLSLETKVVQGFNFMGRQRISTFSYTERTVNRELRFVIEET